MIGDQRGLHEGTCSANGSGKDDADVTVDPSTREEFRRRELKLHFRRMDNVVALERIHHSHPVCIYCHPINIHLFVVKS